MIKVNVSSHIKSIEPYEGGLPIEEVARELNIPEQDIVKLASNENPGLINICEDIKIDNINDQDLVKNYAKKHEIDFSIF